MVKGKIWSMLAEVDLTLSDISDDGDSDECPWPSAIVPVHLNGHGPFPFAVELQRGRTMLTEAVVRAIGVDPVVIPEKLTLKGQGCSLDFPLLKLKSLAIGAAEQKGFDAMVWLFPEIAWEPERPLREVKGPIGNIRSSSQEEWAAKAAKEPNWKGILGFDFLKHFKVTFNFPEKKLRLESVP